MDRTKLHADTHEETAVTNTPLPETRVDPNALIRNEPVQARSTARLAALLDAAAEVVAEIGYERLTTAMVAERAGASIGTVYRYFPDRIALLQSLAARNAERTIDKMLEFIASPDYANWAEALGATFDHLVSVFRDEPGFASLRLGDVLDLRPAEGMPANAVVAHQLFAALVERFDLPDTEEGRLALEAAVECVDALVARAFARDEGGYQPFLDHAKAVTVALVAPHFGQP